LAILSEGFSIEYHFKEVLDYVWGGGFKDSPLNFLSNSNNKKYDCKNKVNEFKKYFTENDTHVLSSKYRKTIRSNEDLQTLFTDIGIFFRGVSLSKNFIFKEGDIERFSEVIAEIADNGLNHGNADCLVDVDVDDSYLSPNTKEKYIRVSVVSINLSKKELHTDLKEMFSKAEDDDEYMRNTILKKKQLEEAFEAFITHRENLFDDEYNEKHFFKTAVLQNKISGRVDSQGRAYIAGGTGFSVILKALEESAEDHVCYLMSGADVLMFEKELLSSEKGKWVGYRDDVQYYSKKPDKAFLMKSRTHMPGVAYNLIFLFKKEEL